MSGSRPKSSEGHLAEQHLGDRLSALVDGELGHDARERVLAHVATCPKCKAEVDAQRRLKNVFAEAAPPPPSESLLARLQGLPAGGDPDAGGPPLGGGGLPGGVSGRFGTSGVFGVKRGERFEFEYAPARPHTPVLRPSSLHRGFRIHDVSRHESDRSASRGLRFAFVAAGAVSLAAIALGGVTAGAPTDTEARGSGSGSNVTPMRTQGMGTATPESQRRRGGVPLLGQGQGQVTLGDTPVAPTEASAPLLPGMPAPAVPHEQQALHALTAPVVAGAAAMSPLIRPLTAAQPVTLTAGSTLSHLKAPGLLAAPVPDGTPTPTTSAASRMAH
ncbi:zf-HC2 domain-containing protein [Streptomyces sp. TRM68367]|uniref:anti-sigma factor family protein n=1 Tax=Streptomyces sp. TRM68367 TaxID=2758415 RepID=UPI00165BECF1|nr:zf-HC2 domain-containing protein [Streptomyces sp. TRM68367]MBC9730639.1 zf-HC2 domain-containing protein [Streptomyces sp. TRM68367]